jgi:exodeoxyribonuclease VII large subunit
MAACAVPVVSAVGHETDVTIADFVADLRAPTPSAAAELVAPNREDLLGRVAAARAKIGQALRYRLAMLERRLRQQGIDRALSLLHRRLGRGLQLIDEQDYRLRERMRAGLEARERSRRVLEIRLQRFDARPRLALGRRRMERADQRAIEIVRMQLARRRSRFEQLMAHLSQLSPLRILDRGYAIVSHAGGILKDAAESAPGAAVHVRLARGELDVVVERVALVSPESRPGPRP